jgi:hypothetical protein
MAAQKDLIEGKLYEKINTDYNIACYVENPVTNKDPTGKQWVYAPDMFLYLDWCPYTEIHMILDIAKNRILWLYNSQYDWLCCNYKEMEC